MFLTVLLLATALNAAGGDGYCSLSVRAEQLPAYPPSIRVSDLQGRDLTSPVKPVGEFADLEVLVAYVQPNERWVPDTVEEAAFALREMLPTSFYDRLLHAYDRNWHRLTSSGDSDLNERVGDLARHLEKIWGLSWSGRKDPFEALAAIVDFSSASETQLKARCRR